MKNNKGASLLFVSVMVFTLFTFIILVLTMGLHDFQFSKVDNEQSKAYYMAEAGIYYGGSIILESTKALTSPPATVTVNNPFTEYKLQHSFTLTITPSGSNYLVKSQGTYNGEQNTVQALVTIVGGTTITYSQMRKIS